MQELLELLERATNVKTLVYDNDTDQWTIHYKNGLPSDIMTSDLLLDFLENA